MNGVPITEEYIYIETVQRCGEKSVPEIIQYNSVVGDNIEWEFEGTIGKGLQIGDHIIPGGINLNPALGSELPRGLRGSISSTARLELIPAQPNLISDFTVKWIITKQNAFLDIPIMGKQLNITYITHIEGSVIHTVSRSCPMS